MRDYWDNLAKQHGAAAATGLHSGQEYTGDYEAVLAATGFTLAGRVLDIGCGTGRMAKLVSGTYRGCDITPSMVEYALLHGRDAALIEGPESLDGYPTFDRITMMSVFTHINRAERRKYLAVVARLLAKDGEALIDTFEGPEGGGIPFTETDPQGFAEDVKAAGLQIVATFSQDWDGTGAHAHHRIAR